MKKRLLVLGCTGSIGTSTLNIVREFPNQYEVCGLSAHTNEKKLLELSSEFNCSNYTLCNDRPSLQQLIDTANPDICINGVSGSAGLLPSIICLENGVDLALANKETVVMAWCLVKEIASQNNCKIIPVDSEHSAIFSLQERFGKENIEKIILTASGGPFRSHSYEELQTVTVKDALNHPTWKMGKKISIDSATLANKGLEVIEASCLFGFEASNINVTIHPQSLIHSLISTHDGDLYAQISHPDMRRPIMSALTYPHFIENNFKKFDFSESFEMSFFPPNTKNFPLLPLAFETITLGASYSIAYNAANEVAVDLFLKNKISFLDIPKLVSQCLEYDWSTKATNIEDVFILNNSARKKTEDLV